MDKSRKEALKSEKNLEKKVNKSLDIAKHQALFSDNAGEKPHKYAIYSVIPLMLGAL